MTLDPQPAPKFLKPTHWNPPKGGDSTLDAYCAVLQTRTNNYSNTSKFKTRDNLTTDQRQALQQLRILVKDRQLRISPADKGGAVVVQDTSDYTNEALRQLKDTTYYTQLKKDPTINIAKRSNELIKKLHSQDHIDDNTYQWALVKPTEVRTHQYYLLPKIHKTLNNPPGRPIISGVQGPTEKLSRLVDHWLQNHVQTLPSYIKDSTDMLRTLQEWNHRYGPFPAHTRLVTIDVVSLYSNIPHHELLAAIRHYLRKPLINSTTTLPPICSILEIADHVLTNNVFQFEQQIYRQTLGTAMGTPMAPSAANLFMGQLENKLLEESPIAVLAEFWKRFIDDIFLLWTGNQSDLQTFFNFINSAHPTIKFTMNNSLDSLPFLDIIICLRDGYLHSDIFWKPTDVHAYLPSSSCHPRHVLRNMPVGEFTRLRRLCSDDQVFLKRCHTMRTWFLRRGHHPRDIARAIDTAMQTPRLETLQYKPKPCSDRTPFVISHHPSNPPLRQWLTELHSELLSTSSHMQDVAPNPPLLGERNCKNLRALLMPSALPSPPQDTAPGCYRCKKKCVVCSQHLVATDTIRSSTTGTTYKLTQRLTCETANIVYLLYCDTCTHAQYIGETENMLKTRFYLHRTHIKQNTGTLVTQHFNQANHSIRNMRCIAVEKVHGSSRAARIAREKFWMNELKSVTPNGLNKRE